MRNKIVAQHFRSHAKLLLCNTVSETMLRNIVSRVFSAKQCCATNRIDAFFDELGVLAILIYTICCIILIHSCFLKCAYLVTPCTVLIWICLTLLNYWLLMLCHCSDLHLWHLY